jgi:two-component system, OmpR family, phosphate regulon sensor histidine kinase PhoR
VPKVTSREGVIPATALFSGLALMAVGAAFSFKEKGALDVPLCLAGAGFLVLLAVFPLLNRELLIPLRKLKKTAKRIAGSSRGDGEEDVKTIGEVAQRLEKLQKELSESLFETRELKTTVNVFMSEKQQTEAVIRSLPIPVLVTDGFGDLIGSNEVAGRLFGFKPDECKGKPIAEAIDFPRIIDLVKQTSAQKVKTPRRTVELNYKSRDDCVLDLRVSFSSVIDSSGQMLGVVTIIQDITKDREIDRMKSEFVANVSHELKTPLSSIQAYVEMLVDGEAQDEETRQDFYSIVDAESRRLSAMIENLLNLSRLDAGVVDFRRERVNLHKIFQSVSQVIEPHTTRKRQSFEAEISPYLDPVLGDPDYLQRVFMNLLSNAAKYTPEGGQVSLEASTEGETVLVEVVDSGCGISREELDKIFDSFYRVKGTSDKAKGTGLGLAIAKKIIEMHNGSIEVESVPGKGSRFRVRLPVAA